MIFVLVGPPSLTKQKQEELILQNHFQQEERFTYDLETISFFSFLEEVSTISFLSPRKIVIVKNAFFLGTETVRKVAEEEIDAFLDYLLHPSEDVLMILSVPKLDERKKKLMKAIKENTTVSFLSYDLREQIKKIFKDYQISEEAIQKLMLALKGEESRLSLECEKLKCYKMDEKKITVEDIEEMVLPALPDQETTIFSFSSSLASRDKKKAYQDYQLLEKMGVDSLSLMGLLENQFRTLYQVKILSQEGLSQEQIAKTLGYHPFRVQKTQELSRLYSKKAIRDFLYLLQKLDLEMKSGKIDGQLLIDLLIMRGI